MLYFLGKMALRVLFLRRIYSTRVLRVLMMIVGRIRALRSCCWWLRRLPLDLA